MEVGDKVSFIDEENRRTMRGYVTKVFDDGMCVVADTPKYADPNFYDIQWAQMLWQRNVTAGWPTRSPGGWEK